MQIQIIDNVLRTTASFLIPVIMDAEDVRIAVAYVSSEGLLQIMPSVRTALEHGASIEFLVGMDTHATDPIAVRDLYVLSQETQKSSLFCFASRNTYSIYHPKIYLTKKDQSVTAMIGSSNLTKRGLETNIEVNIAITDDIHTEIMSDIYSTYNRLKYHPNRVIPDEEFISIFADLCHKEKSTEKRVSRDAKLRELKEIFIKKANRLQHPKPSRADLVGWLELVYDVLPDGEFTNHQVYEFEKEFSQRFPLNQNIKAKIRQQLQFLQKMGFVQHVEKGVWRKVS